MFYHIMRTLVKFSLHFYIKRIAWSGTEHIPKSKPVLFCATHSNSFLDALFYAANLWKPLYVLTRGDVFKKPAIRNILYGFKLLPIFRQSEGEEKAAQRNEESFQESLDLFKDNQYIMIFPEGISQHQKEVLPLKKGAVALAQRAWSAGIPLQVIPVGVDYSQINFWGASCDVIAMPPILASDFENIESPTFAKEFNEKLTISLKKAFPSPYQFQNNPLHWGIFGQILYYVGWVFHFPLYFLAKFLSKKYAGKSVFYDSAIIGILSFLLPFYYLILIIIAILYHFLG